MSVDCEIYLTNYFYIFVMFGTLNTSYFKDSVFNGGKPVFNTPVKSSSNNNSSMWGAIAQAAVGAAQLGLANSQGRRAYRQQLGLLQAQTGEQKDLMNHQFDQNVKFWKMQNAYNTPAAQRGRLEDAGINPNLAMSGSAGSIGMASGSNPTSQSSSSVPHSQATDVRMQHMQIAQQYAMNAAQTYAIESQAKLNEANAKKVNSETTGQDINNAFNKIQTEFWQKYGELKWKLDLNKTDSEVALNDAQRYVQSMDYKLKQYDLNFTRPAIYQRTLEESLLTHLNQDLSRLNAAKTEAETKKIWNEIKLSTALALSTIRYQASMGSAALTTADANKINALTNFNNWQVGKGVLWRLNDNNAYIASYKGLVNEKLYTTVFSDYLVALKTQYKLRWKKNEHFLNLFEDDPTSAAAIDVLKGFGNDSSIPSPFSF
ncbi:DNA pilot protein [Microvirus mar65]|uniref:DNA pilot protein n=1 Tax=Microvirus mar65 TaxID=2851202 RepID=A0A8F5MKI4_9VIRU|nr:DNA pilot protein [Microvirus mar65]